MMPLYRKLNYLVAQTAPNYSYEGRIRTPFLKLTIGEWFNKLPGLITSVGLSWQKDYPWEIALDRYQEGNSTTEKGKDYDMMILPHVLDVNVSFQPIHDFVPRNTMDSPFIIPEKSLYNLTSDSEDRSSEPKTDTRALDFQLNRGNDNSIGRQQSGIDPFKYTYYF